MQVLFHVDDSARREQHDDPGKADKKRDDHFENRRRKGK